MLSRQLLRASALAAFAASAVDAAPDDAVRINQLQVIGTHNSYHAGLTPEVARLMMARAPRQYDALDYSHPSLTRQLDEGVRQLELDVFSDARGGRFAHPFGATLQKDGPPYDPTGVMAKPGFKVLHVQDLDYVSNCQPFVGCLEEIRAWSRAHPSHAPIFILVETKTDAPIASVPGMATPEPFTPQALDALDAEIRSVFPRRETITPDDVRGPWRTLPQAIANGGWPSLAKARGKVIFLLDQTNVTADYVAGHPALRGRVLFTNARPGAPDAAFTEFNDPNVGRISALVARGYIVRTRADADTREARLGDIGRRDLALSSGAQIVSTDYPADEPARWTDYAVALPGRAVVHCDPVNAPPSCEDAALNTAARAP